MPDMLQEISNFIITSKYARHLPEELRRETWVEAIDRVEGMHLRKFSHLDQDLKNEIHWAFDMARDKKVLPSMRSVQYAGPAIEATNERSFNCSATYLDRPRAFAEIFYLLLCGSGVGVSLSRQFVDKLPDLISPKDFNDTPYEYWVADTIEGWADSLEALMETYFVHTATSGRQIKFVYDLVREEGSPIKTGGGKAPGPDGLRLAHERIRSLLNSLVYAGYRKLRPIDAGDVVLHASDAVLSGGVRRSALLFLFDKDDEEMLNAKVGDWYVKNPQRGRANNSILIERDNVTLEDFERIILRTREFGEPGFVFANNSKVIVNPCQPGWAPLLTPRGIQTMANIEVGDKIWSETGWTTVVKKLSTGTKDVYRYSTTAGSFYGTKDHRLVSNGMKIEARACESIDILVGPQDLSLDKLDSQDITDGLVIGDGYISKYATVTPEEIAKTRERTIPHRFVYGDAHKVAGFLRGLYSANGSVVKDRVTFRTTSPVLREQVQLMLSSIGIRSYCATDATLIDGTRKESYDIYITVDRNRFARLIGFIQSHKNDKLARHLNTDSGRAKLSYDVISVDKISTEEVFDITVDNDTHTYWTNGLNVSNCGEVGFVPTIDGESAVGFCNLSSINVNKVETEDDFLEATRAAAIIGTLQASYTNFKYLSSATKRLAEEEALLGVSMTAMMDNYEVAFSEAVQQKGSRVVTETNEAWAQHLGISPAARATVIKPEGTGTLAVGSMSNGIHPAHSRQFFRRIQMNKNENVYQFFKQYNPHMCEPSQHAPNGTDDIVTFPVELPSSTRVKADFSAIEHLDLIRSTQLNWVLPGTSSRNTRDTTHSVSCTVIVHEHEWEEVIRYLYNHRYNFSAVSLLAASGDKLYKQAPFEAVMTESDDQKFRHLLDNYIPVDYTLMQETEDGTSLTAEGSCFGGACTL